MVTIKVIVYTIYLYNTLNRTHVYANNQCYTNVFMSTVINLRLQIHKYKIQVC